jgi:hypothetical protein
MENIQIKLTDGSVEHNDIKQSGLKDQVLVIVTAEGDEIRYSPTYWQAYVVNAKGDDPLGLSD